DIMFDAQTYHGQPSAMQPQFPTQALFGMFPGQYGQLSRQPIAGCLPQQQLRRLIRQPHRFLPFDPGLVTHALASFAPYLLFGPRGAALGHAIGGGLGYPQVPSFLRQNMFGAFGTPGGQFSQPQFGQPAGQAIGAWPGQLPLGGFGPQGLLGALQGQYGQQPIGAIAGWPGHSPFGGFAPQGWLNALAGRYGSGAGPIGGWPGVCGRPPLGPTAGRGVLARPT